MTRRTLSYFLKLWFVAGGRDENFTNHMRAIKEGTAESAANKQGGENKQPGKRQWHEPQMRSYNVSH